MYFNIERIPDPSVWTVLLQSLTNHHQISRSSGDSAVFAQAPDMRVSGSSMSAIAPSQEASPDQGTGSRGSEAPRSTAGA